MLGGGLAWTPLGALVVQGKSAGPAADVRHVLVMFKCHFDAGFIDTQTAVVHKYFTQYFPQAIQVAAQARQAGHGYVWTTGSWLLYEYLEQASMADRKTMERAITNGDIAWHALPFSWETELMDESIIAGSLGLSQSLDRRFGRTTTGAKMTDVPGHTRGIAGPLAAHGVTFLDIGVNDASTPARVPPLFVWQDSKGAKLTVMYHLGYGGVAQVPASDLAIAIVVRGDNSGPHTREEIAKTYADLKQQFPNAQIVASNLTSIANAVAPHAHSLPVVTEEIGDTWIYGVASDPRKMARYREVARLRQSWIAKGKFKVGDPTDLALLRRLLLEVEHTWGTDTKTWLDFDHYLPADLATMLDTKNYKVVEFSWNEKRQDLFDGIKTLPPAMRDEAHAAVQALDAKEPQMKPGSSHAVTGPIETEHFTLGLDAKTGAITRLTSKTSGREWASPEHPLGLFVYQTLSQDDYSQFFKNYIVSTADWAKKDFGKPNIERFGVKSRDWTPTLREARVEKNDNGYRVLSKLEIDAPEEVASGRASFPKKMYMELLLPKASPVVELNFYWFDKPASRLPEALWLTFNPVSAAQPVNNASHGWRLDKVSEQVSPFDVVEAGSRHLHGVAKGFSYHDSGKTFAVETLDAPLIAVGARSPLNFSTAQPDLSTGVHCSLFNNAWGTNYIMWFGEDMRFRFVLRA